MWQEGTYQITSFCGIPLHSLQRIRLVCSAGHCAERHGRNRKIEDEKMKLFSLYKKRNNKEKGLHDWRALEHKWERRDSGTVISGAIWGLEERYKKVVRKACWTECSVVSLNFSWKFVIKLSHYSPKRLIQGSRIHSAFPDIPKCWKLWNQKTVAWRTSHSCSVSLKIFHTMKHKAICCKDND